MRCVISIDDDSQSSSLSQVLFRSGIAILNGQNSAQWVDSSHIYEYDPVSFSLDFYTLIESTAVKATLVRRCIPTHDWVLTYSSLTTRTRQVPKIFQGHWTCHTSEKVPTPEWACLTSLVRMLLHMCSGKLQTLSPGSQQSQMGSRQGPGGRHTRSPGPELMILVYSRDRWQIQTDTCHGQCWTDMECFKPQIREVCFMIRWEGDDLAFSASFVESAATIRWKCSRTSWDMEYRITLGKRRIMELICYPSYWVKSIWDCDLISFIGCGERGNAEVVAQFR